MGCHNASFASAKLDLHEIPTGRGVLEKLLERISTGRMPPPGAPMPSKVERNLASVALERALGIGDNPGRVTAHRLNRVEYNNSVRDLLGVSIRPADDFPLDDAGYGFDNIGDVLSVSPLLMEKYATAARRTARIAVYGESYPLKPSKLTRLLGKKTQDDATANALPYSIRGALWASYNFPVDGEYEFRMRVANYRPRDTAGTDREAVRQRKLTLKFNLSEAEKTELMELNRIADPPVKMVFSVDGKAVYTEIVEGNLDYQYAHGESVARVKLKAGEHSFRASFPEYAGMEKPRTNVNLDGRRKLFTDYFDIVGPFNPAPVRKGNFICAARTPECSQRIVEDLARRAWRRVPTQVEVDELTELATQVRKDSESFDEGVRVVLQAILMSPNFLFRIEREPDGPLNAYSLASRLSFFLWSAPPDEALLRAAARGTTAVRAEATRMMADAKANALVENFAGQWLGLRILDRRKPDPVRFPLVDDELLEWMRRESELFARAILRENRSVLEFIDGRFTYVNGPLARHYRIAGVSGEEFQRVELDGVQRGGVLGQGAILALSSYATRTSPVIRGKWVLENLLGAAPPPPPADVPALDEPGAGTGLSGRQLMEQHRAKEECAACHRSMDPIGFALENYDASGAWREREGNFAVNASGTLPGGRAFSGPGGLKQALLAQPDAFVRNFAEKMLTYALGRGVEAHDRQTLDRIVERMAADGYRFSTLVNEIIDSRPFRMRKSSVAVKVEEIHAR